MWKFSPWLAPACRTNWLVIQPIVSQLHILELMHCLEVGLLWDAASILTLSKSDANRFSSLMIVTNVSSYDSFDLDDMGTASSQALSKNRQW
ncbi:hypothetical protein SDJN02_01273, partial [Cucurbita argyrosperma subsp. argyrosperma]